MVAYATLKWFDFGTQFYGIAHPMTNNKHTEARSWDDPENAGDVIGTSVVCIHLFSKIFDFQKITSSGVFSVADHESDLSF